MAAFAYPLYPQTPSPTRATLSVEPPSQAGAQLGSLVPSTPWRAEELLGTISGVLKKPPGFTHLTQNKNLIGRLGFCSRFAFFSAGSRGGGGGGGGLRAAPRVFLVQTSFLKGTQPSAHTPAHTFAGSGGPAKPERRLCTAKTALQGGMSWRWGGGELASGTSFWRQGVPSRPNKTELSTCSDGHWVMRIEGAIN